MTELITWSSHGKQFASISNMWLSWTVAEHEDLNMWKVPLIFRDFPEDGWRREDRSIKGHESTLFLHLIEQVFFRKYTLWDAIERILCRWERILLRHSLVLSVISSLRFCVTWLQKNMRFRIEEIVGCPGRFTGKDAAASTPRLYCQSLLYALNWVTYFSQLQDTKNRNKTWWAQLQKFIELLSTYAIWNMSISVIKGLEIWTLSETKATHIDTAFSFHLSSSWF